MGIASFMNHNPAYCSARCSMWKDGLGTLAIRPWHSLVPRAFKRRRKGLVHIVYVVSIAIGRVIIVIVADFGIL